MKTYSIVLTYTPRDGIDWQPSEIVREFTTWAEERGLSRFTVEAVEVVPAVSKSASA